MYPKARRKDLDCAKGLGILLVVAGHFVPATAKFPQGNLWYLYLREVLYEFHMPFFMYLSGYVTFLSGAADTGTGRWTTLVRRRAFRLLLPFAIFGVVIVAGKWLASQMFYVDNMPASISDAMLGMVWKTDESPATSVWYVLVLFVYCVVTPPLLWASKGRVWPLLVLALVLYAAPIPHVLYLDRVATYYVFFILGGASVQRETAWLAAIDEHNWGFFGFFVIVVAFEPLLNSRYLDWHAKMLIAGTLSIPALHGLVRRPAFIESAALLRLGAFSFVIYLLNTPFIGVIKGVLLKWIPFDGVYFLLYATLFMIGGTVGPILIKRFILRPVPILDRITE
jgi:fucose 4-O-acetylase-like acetyltransferase